MFMDAFDSLPIACVVNEKYFCVHGGITDKIKTVLVIVKIRLTKFRRLIDLTKFHYQGHIVTLFGLIQHLRQVEN